MRAHPARSWGCSTELRLMPLASASALSKYTYAAPTINSMQQQLATLSGQSPCSSPTKRTGLRTAPRQTWSGLDSPSENRRGLWRWFGTNSNTHESECLMAKDKVWANPKAFPVNLFMSEYEHHSRRRQWMEAASAASDIVIERLTAPLQHERSRSASSMLSPLAPVEYDSTGHLYPDPRAGPTLVHLVTMCDTDASHPATAPTAYSHFLLGAIPPSPVHLSPPWKPATSERTTAQAVCKASSTSLTIPFSQEFPGRCSGGAAVTMAVSPRQGGSTTPRGPALGAGQASTPLLGTVSGSESAHSPSSQPALPAVLLPLPTIASVPPDGAQQPHLESPRPPDMQGPITPRHAPRLLPGMTAMVNDSHLPAHLNGQSGVVVGFDPGSLSYSIQFKQSGQTILVDPTSVEPHSVPGAASASVQDPVRPGTVVTLSRQPDHTGLNGTAATVTHCLSTAGAYEVKVTSTGEVLTVDSSAITITPAPTLSAATMSAPSADADTSGKTMLDAAADPSVKPCRSHSDLGTTVFVPQNESGSLFSPEASYYLDQDPQNGYGDDVLGTVTSVVSLPGPAPSPSVTAVSVVSLPPGLLPGQSLVSLPPETPSDYPQLQPVAFCLPRETDPTQQQ
eukprot:gene10420-1890_t